MWFTCAVFVGGLILSHAGFGWGAGASAVTEIMVITSFCSFYVPCAHALSAS